MDQKVHRLPFFRFLQKITAVTPIFCQKNIYSWKTTYCHAHNQSKNVKFKIQGALISLFKFFSSKTSCSHAHIWLKTSILSKLQNIMGQKSLQDAISFRFSRKMECSHAHIVSKRRPLSKKHTALMHIYFFKTTSILLKVKWSHVIFFKFMIKALCCQAHIWSKTRKVC